MSVPTPPFYVVVDAHGDLTLRVYKIFDDNESFLAANGKDSAVGRIVAMFKVSLNFLIQHSPAFKYELTNELSKNPTQRCFDRVFGSLLSIEICLRALQNTLFEELYAVPIEEVWKTIQFCTLCRIEFSKLKSWFLEWYAVKLRNTPKEMEMDEMHQLLFPCYILDHALGFASLAQDLAYQVSDHITEKNPTQHPSLHLGGNVIGNSPFAEACIVY